MFQVGEIAFTGVERYVVAGLLVRKDDIHVGKYRFRQVKRRGRVSGHGRLLEVGNTVTAAFEVDACTFGLDAAVMNLLL